MTLIWKYRASVGSLRGVFAMRRVLSPIVSLLVVSALVPAAADAASAAPSRGGDVAVATDVSTAFGSSYVSPDPSLDGAPQTPSPSPSPHG